MTRLGRQVWWAVLAIATAGLLLSLVTVVRSPAEAPPPIDEVRGSAALGVERVAGRTSGRAAGHLGEQDSARTSDRTSGRKGQRSEPASRSRSRGEVERTKAEPPKPARVVRPARLRAPDVGLDLSVAAVGVTRDGQMQLPADPAVLGWYRFGSAPGSGSGSAVLAGHVDSREYGIGPLAQLGASRPGDTIKVVLANGRRAVYRVDSIQRFDRQGLPGAVFSRGGPERLRLVTCTGPYLPDAGGYQQNLVVTAVPA